MFLLAGTSSGSANHAPLEFALFRWRHVLIYSLLAQARSRTILNGAPEIRLASLCRPRMKKAQRSVRRQSHLCLVFVPFCSPDLRHRPNVCEYDKEENTFCQGKCWKWAVLLLQVDTCRARCCEGVSRYPTTVTVSSLRTRFVVPDRLFPWATI